MLHNAPLTTYGMLFLGKDVLAHDLHLVCVAKGKGTW